MDDQDQLKSMPPPLIPLPSTLQHGPKDAFDRLFSDPAPSTSTPLFAPSKSTENGNLPPTPSSAASDFGAFVSVPASMDPLHLGNDEEGTFTPLTEAPSSSEFFDRFTDEAKDRAGENERRVLDELLKHEDDPMYWLSSHIPSQEPSSSADVSNLTPANELTPPPSPPSERLITPRHPGRHENATLPLSSESPPHSPLLRHNSAPSLPSIPSTLSRKWMSSFLSSSIQSQANTVSYDPVISRPHATGSLRDSTSFLSHSSPFAAHVYVAPTGAPGFTGDRRWNSEGFEFDVEDEKPRNVELSGRRESTTPVLTDEIANQLRASLPALPRLVKSWSLLYSLDQHGVSLQTFYARCAALRMGGGTVVVMRDSEDRIFGAWMGEQVRMAPGAYYGSGESFLWRSVSTSGHEHVEVFKWTGKNEYVALCENAFISFGGGEGKYGLYLDNNLIDGSSAKCPTFDNEVLCATIGHDTSKTIPFECVGLEAWAVNA